MLPGCSHSSMHRPDVRICEVNRHCFAQTCLFVRLNVRCLNVSEVCQRLRACSVAVPSLAGYVVPDDSCYMSGESKKILLRSLAVCAKKVLCSATLFLTGL